MKNAKIILVGAGPGDPELFTIKGVKALENANVVLYDALAHPNILKYAHPDAELIFVGKLKGVCQFKQEDINDLMISKAKEKGTVVRLKGGDPFIFGRGHEEKQYAESLGVEVEVIPGLSSCYSVPELAGIPLTRRGVNESFWVVTGTTKEHLLSEDVYEAVKSKATVVILMGMSQLEEIVTIYQNEGKGHLPIAIIQRGSWETEKRGLGTINSILNVVKEKELKSPAVIIIGEVASYLIEN
jgi:uroporphyrin-III C-methyltransferase